jgi:hypothetical protein
MGSSGLFREIIEEFIWRHRAEKRVLKHDVSCSECWKVLFIYSPEHLLPISVARCSLPETARILPSLINIVYQAWVCIPLCRLRSGDNLTLRPRNFAIIQLTNLYLHTLLIWGQTCTPVCNIRLPNAWIAINVLHLPWYSLITNRDTYLAEVIKLAL